MRALTTFLLLVLPCIGFGQFRISGKIIDSADKKPVPGATVFLGNASVGTSTSADGTFTLENVRGGQYEFVVTILGYQTHRQMVLVNQDIKLPDIALAEKATTLQEVSIHPNAEWARNYENFRSDFLGRSDFASQCKIINPELIDINFDKLHNKLEATSSDFIIIENKALGYRIKYLLSVFYHDYPKGVTYFAGTAAFEQMKGTASDQKKWDKNRLKVYKGSSMDFLRSAIANDLDENFNVLRLIRKPTIDLNGKPENKFTETLVRKPVIPADSIVRRTDLKGVYALKFKDCLFVKYKSLSHEPTHILFEKPYALFDNNGIFIDPSAIIFNGEWGYSRVAEMLPVDYEPLQK